MASADEWCLLASNLSFHTDYKHTTPASWKMKVKGTRVMYLIQQRKSLENDDNNADIASR